MYIWKWIWPAFIGGNRSCWKLFRINYSKEFGKMHLNISADIDRNNWFFDQWVELPNCAENKLLTLILSKIYVKFDIWSQPFNYAMRSAQGFIICSNHVQTYNCHHEVIHAGTFEMFLFLNVWQTYHRCCSLKNSSIKEDTTIQNKKRYAFYLANSLCSKLFSQNIQW